MGRLTHRRGSSLGGIVPALAALGLLAGAVTGSRAFPEGPARASQEGHVDWGDSASDVHQDSARERRVERASLPYEEQKSRARREAPKGDSSLSVVISLDRPMTWDDFRSRWETDPLMTAAHRATVYLEAADGYPYTMVGPRRDELRKRILAFLSGPAARVRGEDQVLADGAELVVLGVELTTQAFEDNRDDIASRYGGALIEVYPAASAPSSFLLDSPR